MSNFVIAQILGGLLILLNIVCSSKTTTGKVYFYNGLCNCLSIVQYLLLGGITGAICCFIAVVRNLVFSLFKKEVPLYVLVLYLIIAIAANYSSIHSWIDVLPLINIIGFAIALWTKNILAIKVVGTLTCVNGVIYDGIHKAYVDLLTQVADGVVGVISIRKIIQSRKKKKRKYKKRK